MTQDVEGAIANANYHEWGRVLASVARITRDLDLAEDIVQDAFAAALTDWRRDGVPMNPGAWLTTTARNRALDHLRRSQAFALRMPLLLPGESDETRIDHDDEGIADERLRLIFTCCHPALALKARVALTLRLVCGLRTDEIARLFLVSESTMAARITRAKHKISAAGIPYRVPDDLELPERLAAVLAVVYLLYTEGHTATGGHNLQRPELSRLALHLGALLREMIPGNPEVLGLLALMMLTDARGSTRLDGSCELVLLEDQDRSRWDRAAIINGIALVEQALRATPAGQPGPYAIQAAIAAVHAEAASHEETDWRQIVALYTVLLMVDPSPVAAIGRAVAIGMATDPETGLDAIDRIRDSDSLKMYSMVPAARADMLRRLGRFREAENAYAEAFRLSDNGVVQAFLNRRIGEMRARVTGTKQRPARHIKEYPVDRDSGSPNGLRRLP